jgi:GT2 family glycosyltransferase
MPEILPAKSTLMPGAGLPTCDLVTVNWNAGHQLTECLEAVSGSSQVSFVLGSVVVVDNASTDDSLESAQATAMSLNLIFLRNAQNTGFAAACNQGARESKGDYLLFLNPDTRVEPDAIGTAIAFMESTENVNTAVCGAQLVDENGKISRTCARRPTPVHFATKMLGLDRIAPRRFKTHMMDDWDHRTTRCVDHVMGAFYLIRRSDFERFGGFDERFFVYLEDLDLSIRLRDAGHEIVYLTSARAYHKGGGSSETVKAARLFYSLHSRVRYGYKHFSVVSASLLLLGTLLVEPPIRVLAALMQGAGRDAWNTLCGITLLWRALLRLPRNSPSSGPLHTSP